MVDEIKVEHVLILAIVVFLLYHFIGRCRCNGFRVGGEPSTFIGGDIWKDLETRAIPDPPHGDMWEDLKRKAQDKLDKCKRRIDTAVKAEKEACDIKLEEAAVEHRQYWGDFWEQFNQAAAEKAAVEHREYWGDFWEQFYQAAAEAEVLEETVEGGSPPTW